MVSFAIQEIIALVGICTLGPLAVPLLLLAWLCSTCYFFALSVRGRLADLALPVPPMGEPPTFQRHTCQSHDGLTLTYYISEGGDRDKVILLASPLGQHGPLSFVPLLAALGAAGYTIISWDYRGFWGSQAPHRRRMLTIHEHAQDAATVLDAAGLPKVEMMIGHSLGVQVALESVLIHPERFGKLVLINGCHGHAFDTAFQVSVRLPLIGNVVAALVAYLQRHPWVFRTMRDASWWPMKNLFLPMYVQLFGSRKLAKILGPNYLYDFWKRYMAGLLDDDPRNLEHFLFTFQEINAHSVHHLLHKIEQPTLVISGFFDTLLPAMVSEEIAQCMPTAKHLCDPWSTHATVLESPEWTLAQVWRFLHHGTAGWR